MALFWFLLMIGPLVFFHELGHFVAARRFGVKCERFAIGMGPAVASFRRGDTEFSIRAFPLGGYVSMLGAVPDDQIDEEDVGKALTDKPVWQRMIIYLAGPLANVLIAVPVFWIFFLAQGVEEGPEIGMVLDGSPAAEAGLLPGDRIVDIDGKEIRYFDQIRRIASRSPGETLSVRFERDGEEAETELTPRAIQTRDVVGLRTVERGQIGIVWGRYPSLVHVDHGSAAAAAGLRTFDRVVAVDGEPVNAWLDLRDRLDAASGPVTLDVVRIDRGDPSFVDVGVRRDTQVVLPAGAGADVRSAQASVFSVQPGSPAEAAGIRAGDRVVGADGHPVSSLAILEHTLTDGPVGGHTVRVVRDGAELELTLETVEMEVVGDLRSTHEMTFSGLQAVPAGTVPYELVSVPFGERIVRSTVNAVVKTIEYLLGIFAGVLLLVVGQVDSSNLGGPLMIADVANRAGSQGLLPFLRFMAIISINLAIVNLLPVPGLDGGQLMLLTAEGIRREPLSFRARQIASYVGVTCLVLLMLFAFKNDVERYWVDFANWLNS